MPTYDPKTGTHNFGVVRSAAPPRAPRLELRAGGRERKVDLRKWCPPIRNQGQLGSCLGCSIAGALDILQLKNGDRLSPRSALFAYYNARKVSGIQNREEDGGLLPHAMAGVLAYGSCPEADWPYDISKARTEPSGRAYEAATAFEAVQYARIASTDEAKATISSGVPVIFATTMPMGYFNSGRAGGHVAEYGKVSPGEDSAHAMVAVGYDDDAGTWLVMNSWSERHGDKGFLYIPYSTLDHFVWREDLWAIGALEKLGNARITEMTPREAANSAVQNGPEEMRAALRKLGEQIGADLGKRVSEAKLSIREQLAAQEAELERKRKKD